MRLARLLLVATLACALHAHAQEQKLAPVDEAANDRSWIAFRHRLLTALDQRDRRFLLSIIDARVRNAPGAERGIAEFRKEWDLEAKDSPVWTELASALFLGAAYLPRDEEKKHAPRELCAPYLLAKWPADIDPFGHGAIVAKETAARSAPASDAPPLQPLSYDIVAVTDWDVADRDAASPQRWVKVKLAAGEGYVPAEHVRSPIEHAACFVKGASGWRLTAFAPAGGE
jgi:hypothetical protein